MGASSPEYPSLQQQLTLPKSSRQPGQSWTPLIYLATLSISLARSRMSRAGLPMSRHLPASSAGSALVGTLRPRSTPRLSQALKPELRSGLGEQRESWGGRVMPAKCGGREKLRKGREKVLKRRQVGGLHPLPFSGRENSVLSVKQKPPQGKISQHRHPSARAFISSPGSAEPTGTETPPNLEFNTPQPGAALEPCPAPAAGGMGCPPPAPGQRAAGQQPWYRGVRTDRGCSKGKINQGALKELKI